MHHYTQLDESLGKLFNVRSVTWVIEILMWLLIRLKVTECPALRALLNVASDC